MLGTILAVTRLLGCDCSIEPRPCYAVGSVDTVFVGTVLDINTSPLLSPPRVIRMRVEESFTGLGPGRNQVEIGTGMGGGDCGYPFIAGGRYVVYAFRGRDGRLSTSTCTRTRPFDEAAEDLQYFRTMANAPSTLRVRIANPATTRLQVSAERNGASVTSTTNATGEAVFVGLPPGSYKIHAEPDGDLPTDPRVQVHEKGCLDLILAPVVRITGRVVTRDGAPASGVRVDLRSAFTPDAEVYFRAMDLNENVEPASATTGRDGRYELLFRWQANKFYLGINLNSFSAEAAPHLRWFYPGTEDPASATVIDFSALPFVRTYDITLPDY